MGTLRERYEAGATIESLIGGGDGKSTQTVWEKLKEEGVKMRPRGRRPVDLPDFGYWSGRYLAGEVSAAEVCVYYESLGIKIGREAIRRRARGLPNHR